MLAIPSGESSVAFDENDNNIFSNDSVDVFFDQCYQDRNGWVLMDGQGKLSKSVIFNILSLTNIVFIHFNTKDQ